MLHAASRQRTGHTHEPHAARRQRQLSLTVIRYEPVRSLDHYVLLVSCDVDEDQTRFIVRCA